MGDRVLAGARAIRPELHHLLGDDASEVDLRLEELLNQADNDATVHVEITKLLSERPPTRQWMRTYLASGVSAAVERGYEPLLGTRGPQKAIKYICPRGDSPYFISRVGDTVPDCPVHKIPRVLAS
jgi:hypothetical protein